MCVCLNVCVFFKERVHLFVSVFFSGRPVDLPLVVLLSGGLGVTSGMTHTHTHKNTYTHTCGGDSLQVWSLRWETSRYEGVKQRVGKDHGVVLPYKNKG